MKKEKIKVYIYTRVSTAMQIDGYSLDAQKSRMKAYAEFNDYEIVGEYEDAGKSGKSIEGRVEFNRMMEDIKSGKDGVSYVLVFKLSRFGRNAADVLSTLQVMQDWSAHLDRILTMSGEQLLVGNGSISHKQAIDKATGEYRKYKARTLSEVEQDYLDSIKLLEQKTDNKQG